MKPRFTFEIEEWMEEAACIGVPSAIFFDNTPASNDKAKGMCLKCPVRGKCLDYALDRRLDTDFDGVWGGMTPLERRRIRRSRRRLGDLRVAAGPA